LSTLDYCPQLSGQHSIYRLAVSTSCTQFFGWNANK